MDETRRDPPTDRPVDPPPVAPGERIERHEVVESVPADGQPRRSRGTSMAVWLIPLVLVVFFLMWYVMQEGTPDSPLPESGIELEAPEINASAPEVETPAVVAEPAGQ